MEGLLSERSLGSGAVLLTERDVDVKVLGGGRCDVAENAAARFTHAAARHVRRMRRLLGVIVVQYLF